MGDPRTTASVVTVLNMKGGVGKTHCCWLFVAGCLEQGRRMLAIDTDTQANLTSSLLGTTDPEPPTLERLLDPSVDTSAIDLVRPSRFEGIDVIPSSKSRLLPFDLSDQHLWERSDLHLSYVDVIEELRGQYDYIVIDCPPRLSLVSFAALCASDFVLIPLEAADWGAQGVADVTKAISYVRKRHNDRLHLLGYIVSKFKRTRTFQKAYLQVLRERFGDDVFATEIKDLSQFERSVSEGLPITRYAPRSREASIARTFLEEVEERIGIGRGHRQQNVRPRRTTPVR